MQLYYVNESSSLDEANGFKHDNQSEALLPLKGTYSPPSHHLWG